MIGDSLLERIRKGEPEALAHFKEILKVDGVIEQGDVFALQLAAIEGALAQTGRGKGAAAAKLDIHFSIFEKLSDVRSRHMMEGSADMRAAAAKLMAEDDSEVTKTWTYDKLMMLALAGPASDKEGLDEARQKMISYIESNNYSPVIQVGLALAKIARGEAEANPDFERIANRCLLNAVRYGDSQTSGYAMEAIAIAGDENARLGLMNHLLDVIEFGEGEAKQESIHALLEHFGEDEFVKAALHEMGLANYDIKSGIASIAKAGNGMSERAGRIMADIRNDDERDLARSDREFLLESEYPHDYMAQKMYVELMFKAVDTVMGPEPATKEGEVAYQAALLQLSTQGADPGQLGNLFSTRNDKHNLKIIMRNVENALLYALNNGRTNEALEQAAEGLEKIGSERVADILERIAERHGSDSQKGAIAARTAERVRDSWIVEIVELEPPAALKRPPLPPRPDQQPLSQRPRLSQ